MATRGQSMETHARKRAHTPENKQTLLHKITGMGEMGEVDQKVQTSCYKTNKSWERHVLHGDYS